MSITRDLLTAAHSKGHLHSSGDMIYPLNAKGPTAVALKSYTAQEVIQKLEALKPKDYIDAGFDLAKKKGTAFTDFVLKSNGAAMLQQQFSIDVFPFTEGQERYKDLNPITEETKSTSRGVIVHPSDPLLIWKFKVNENTFSARINFYAIVN